MSIDKVHKWTFNSASSLTSEVILSERIGFEDAYIEMELKQALNSGDSLSTISAATVAAIGGYTAPTIAASELSADKMSVELTVDTALASANSWTFNVTVTTTNGETIKRKGVLVLS